jgi:hypothetical protein
MTDERLGERRLEYRLVPTGAGGVQEMFAKPGGRKALDAENAPIVSPAGAGGLAAASDDRLGLATDGVGLYARWPAAGEPAEPRLSAKGGHGFGSGSRASRRTGGSSASATGRRPGVC